MTDVSEPLAGTGSEPEPGPRLIHSGTYALYATPEGGRVVAYRRTMAAAEDGQILAVTGCPDLHLPVIPVEALPLISTWLENGFPPRILAMLRGGGAGILAGVKDMLNGAGADPDGDG